MHFFIILRRLFLGLVSSIEEVLTTVALYLVDFLCTLFNLVTPDRPVGKVVPAAPRVWREVARLQQINGYRGRHDHTTGLIPRDGKNIQFKELTTAIRKVYNFSPVFCYFLANNAAQLLVRDYRTDRLDLSDLDAHNLIEHDASLTRVDTYDDPVQGKIATALVEELLSSGTGPGGNLTANDISRLLGKRRIESKRRNPTYSLALFHKLFGSFKYGISPLSSNGF
ncbi:hypothetical protein NUW54_g14168 [Trametes sanguinea]|uniref:Uncharacterized protein n=1 Tax=Trametes sanguinea TaxID=158606 RepID=A0ACC1MEF3_9APHY|nr:hypothetical protein NUW54_g14168 [Trametes sanguinea]